MLTNILTLLENVYIHSKNVVVNFLKLMYYVCYGTNTVYKVIIMFLRLVCFSLLLLPGWIKLIHRFIFNPLVIKNMEYGQGAKNRNMLDIFIPPFFPSTKKNKSLPIVIFYSGGAWIIGYKFWGCIVGFALSKFGILTIVPDYRNFPQGDIEDMISDVKASIQWTIDNAYRFNGDCNRIVLAGQSAGAHICLMTLIKELDKKINKTGASSFPLDNLTTIQAILMKSGHESSLGETAPTEAPSAIQIGGSGRKPSFQLDSWINAQASRSCPVSSSHDDPLPMPDTALLPHICLFVGISGPYNICKLLHHLHGRGLDMSILSRIFLHDTQHYSCAPRLQKLASTPQLLLCFPPVALFHGTLDVSAPVEGCLELVETLRSIGVPTTLRLLTGQNHTDSTLEGPLGGDDLLFREIAALVQAKTGYELRTDHDSADTRYVSQALVQMARFINPF